MENRIDQVGFLENDNRTQQKHFSSASKGSSLVLDIVALSEFPARFTYLGDRTILRDVKRVRWFDSVDAGNEKSTAAYPPRHGIRKDSAEKIANALYTELKCEIEKRTAGMKNIGILLSGGMDSRMVAGILKQIQDETQGMNVTVFTWGQSNSRDPVYAERIAMLFDWNYEHFDITVDTLKRNISIAASEGCSYGPHHLHAMYDVSVRAKALCLDCIIAGSYGDSIGRAEYSSTKVLNLRPFESWLGNHFGIINKNIYSSCKQKSLNEINRYRTTFGQQSNWALNELDYQLHYMRNQLGTCMSIISKNIPLIQCFTAKTLVELMWSYHPSCRTDQVYYELLNKINPDLHAIPWARNGKRFLDESGTPDDIPKSDNKYGEWVREELSEYLDSLIFRGDLEKTNVFNMHQVEYLIKVNKKLRKTNTARFDEIILWLATVGLFLQKNDYVIEEQFCKAKRKSFTGTAYTMLYAYKRKHVN